MVLARRLLVAGRGGSFTPLARYPPTDDSWVRSGSNPILSPDVAWEETAIGEAVVIYDGTWKMWYGAGWDHPGLGYATSTDGISWVKYASNPVYGQGGSGYANTSASAEVVRIGSTLYLFTSGGTSPSDIRSTFRVATSSDGIAWTTQASSATLPAGTTYWGNRSVWIEGATWYMIQEAGLVSGTYWAIYLYTSSDGLTWTITNGGAQLSSLQASAGGAYGGSYLIREGATYHLWYHAVASAGNVPTNIYHATSTDRINWTQTSPNPVLTHTGSGFEIDQVADPSLAVAGSTAYLFYSAVDNVAETSHVLLATAPAVI